MRTTLRQILAPAAGVLLAATYVSIVVAVGGQMDWKGLGFGAVLITGLVWMLAKKEDG